MNRGEIVSWLFFWKKGGGFLDIPIKIGKLISKKQKGEKKR